MMDETPLLFRPIPWADPDLPAFPTLPFADDPAPAEPKPFRHAQWQRFRLTIGPPKPSDPDF